MPESKKKSLEKKRLRNRLAQRAFRHRQANRLKHLQNQVDSNDKPYDETVKALQEENNRLRRDLIAVQSNLARLITTMQKMSETVSSTLGECPQPELPGIQGRSQEFALNDQFGSLSEEPDLGVEEYEPEENNYAALDQTQTMGMCDFDYLGDSIAEAITTTDTYAKGERFATIMPQAVENNAAKYASFGNPTQQIPSVWSLEYQMGVKPYANALARSADLRPLHGQSWLKTNSSFSDHVQVLQRLLKTKIAPRMPLIGPTMKLFYKEVLVVLALFNSLNRPDVMRWYAKTRFYHIVHLTAWQIYPCDVTFNAIHPQYRPTALQLRSRYPRTIDWIPFSSIRDRLIRLHAGNPLIDQIVCDAVSSYVVETCMSDLIMGAPATKAYIRVLDLVTNIDDVLSSSRYDSAACLPAPDVSTLFSSQACSKAIFDLLSVDCGVSNYKVDPAFFERYPELYDHRFDIIPTGIPLRPDVQHRLSCPKPLTPQTLQTYCNFLDFSYDASLYTNVVSY